MASLDVQINAIGRRVRGLLGLHALSWLVGSAVVAIVVLCLADYWLHFEDRGVRIMLTIALAGVVGWAAWRFVWPVMRARFDTVELAQRIERRFPQFKDRLASTVQFLQQPEDDWRHGSGLLRRTVIHQTSAEAERVNLADVIEVRPVARTLLAASLVLLAAVGVYALDPPSARLALARLMNPLGSTQWPQESHLGFSTEVTRVAHGESFELEIIDLHGAPLPPQVDLHFRYDDDGTIGERIESISSTGSTSTFLVSDVTRPFSYRATGGDDATMPWIDLEVVEPPSVEQLEVTLHYPEYTGWPPTSADAHLRALAGTRVAISGRSTKPLKSATFEREDGSRVVGVGGEDRTFSFPLDGERPIVLRESGWYAIDLEDTEGIHGGRTTHYDVRVVEDRAPSVTLELPEADKFVTAQAVVPLRVAVKDDLAIRDVVLVQSGDPQAAEKSESQISLYQGPATPIPPVNVAGDSDTGEQQVIEHAWELGTLKLREGTTLEFYVRANDYQPLESKSHVRRLTIVSGDELQDRLAERRSLILNELTRLLGLERESRAQITGLQIQLDQVGKLNKDDVDHLQQAELTQRQVDRGLGDSAESVPSHIANLLDDLAQNKVENSELESRMRGMLDELRSIERDHLPVIRRDLTAALKQMQSDLGDKTQPESSARTDEKRSLASVGTHQDEVVGALERVLGELSEWDNYRRFHRELTDLRREQQKLVENTSTAAARTLTQDVKDLSPQQAADLKRLSQRQLDVAREFDKIEQRMREIEVQLRESDPTAADSIADALNHARDEALAGRMREASRNVEGNQVGQAAGAQKQILGELDELLDILSNRRQRELDRLVKQLRESERQLEDIRAKQDGLQKKMEAAAKIADPEQRKRELERLTREQQALQEETERLARTLKRLEASNAGDSARQASEKMGQADQSAESGQPQDAAEQAAAAARDLEEAQQQLAERRRQAERDLANEQMARIEDTLAAMKSTQDRLLKETRQYAELEQQRGRLSRAESMSVADLARQQSALRDESQTVADKLATAPIIQLALSSAAGDMRVAGERLAERNLDTETQTAQQSAAAKLARLIEAFQKPKDDAAQQKEDGASGQGGDSGGSQTSASLPELRLLKLMQEDVNARTKALDEAVRDKATITPPQQREYERLAAEQGKLADLLSEMTKGDEKSAPDAGESLEKLLDPQDKP